LLTYSEQFDNAAWTKTRSSITADATTSPDGTQDADKLVEDTATNTHDMTVSVSFTSGTAYTLSIYAKQAGRNLRIYFPSGAFGSAFSAVFDLSAGTATIAFTGTVASITNVGNGWYRCSITQTATASVTSIFTLRLIEGASTTSYTGDGTSGIYIWGAQLEAGAFATSYIPTVASQVTRSADAVSMTGTNFSDWYNQAQGTLYGEFDWMGLSNNDYFFAINNSSSNNLIALGVSSTPTTRFIVTDGGVTQASIAGPTLVANTLFKIAGAYQVNNFRAATNGILGTADTSGTVPAGMTEVSFTTSFGTVNAANGHIRKVAYYPLAVTSAQLQALTS
jgi:hypothetical protein